MEELLRPVEGISAEDWAVTPPSVRALVLLQSQQIGALAQRVLDLEQRLNLSSHNSSKPPSSDPPSAPPRPQKVPRGRNAGGQVGHPGSTRERREPDEIVECRPTDCPHCLTALPQNLPDAAPLVVTQVWELPLLRPIITDYQQHTVCCPTCAARIIAPAPSDALTGYGARVTALCGHLHGTYHLSYRAIADLLADIAALPIGLASVVASCQRLSEALLPIDAALHTALLSETVVNVDETSWREQGKRCWLWTATSARLTCFRITTSRGRTGLDVLLDASYSGIVGSDRWNAYNRYANDHRQLCWAHLKRNVRALAEGQMPESPWADGLLAQIHALFLVWHRFRDGRIDRAGLASALLPMQQTIDALLRTGQTKQWHKIVTLSNELLVHWDALWTFVGVEGVEPTNNAAERVLRPAVIWRKQCFGTQSAAGSRFVERLLTVVTTCRQQQHNVWSFLTQAITAARTGLPAPALLPSP